MKFHPPNITNLSLLANRVAVCPPLGSGGLPFVLGFLH
jgi:hypothetical protein